MTVQISDELARLHRLISWYDVPRHLPSAALAGEACVWCTTPADETAVELEPSAPLPRLGCTPCYVPRLAWYVSWYDWRAHTDICTHCQQRNVCFVAHGRRILHEQTIGPAGRAKLSCAVCPAPVLSTELVVPHLWDGDARPHLGYAHVRCLAKRGPFETYPARRSGA